MTPSKPHKEKRSGQNQTDEDDIDPGMGQPGLVTPVKRTRRPRSPLTFNASDAEDLEAYGFAEIGSRSTTARARPQVAAREFDESLLAYLSSSSPASNTVLRRCWVGLSQDAQRIFVTISVPSTGFGNPTFKYFYYGNKGQSASLSAVMDYNSELVQYGLWTGWLAPRWKELRRFNQPKPSGE
jgi:hypothetical protein